jgi:hypothetical protein
VRGCGCLDGSLAQFIGGDAGTDADNPAETIRLHEKSLAAAPGVRGFELPGGNIRR